MKKIILGLSVLALMFTKTVYAVCPLCTVVVGAGIGFAEWLGVDDTITGLWIGALTISMIIWTVNWLDRRNIRFKGRKIVTALIYYLVLIVPLYYPLHFIGHPLNKLWGIDRLLLGIIVGSVLFFAGAVSYVHMKANNDGHAYFPFQKVIQPVAPLVIMSIVFYFITRYY